MLKTPVPIPIPMNSVTEWLFCCLSLRTRPVSSRGQWWINIIFLIIPHIQNVAHTLFTIFIQICLHIFSHMFVLSSPVISLLFTVSVSNTWILLYWCYVLLILCSVASCQQAFKHACLVFLSLLSLIHPRSPSLLFLNHNHKRNSVFNLLACLKWRLD